MQKHTKIYLESRGFTGLEYIPCEVCGVEPCVDVHHVFGRRIEDCNNPGYLLGLGRKCHSNQLILNALKVGYNLHEYDKI